MTLQQAPKIGDEAHKRANRESFRRELTSLLNRYSMEGESDTQDFLLADYLMLCLTALEKTIRDRKRLSDR
jgi:hypothetical protein